MNPRIVISAPDISFEERKEIERLLSIGASIKQIALSLNRSHSGIKNELKKFENKKSYNATKAQEIADRNKYQRFIKAFKNVSKEDGETIERLAKEKTSIAEISLQTKLTRHMVRKHLVEKGLYHELPTTKKGNRSHDERISSLEMQMEIIIDQLKELHEHYIKNG